MICTWNISYYIYYCYIYIYFLVHLYTVNLDIPCQYTQSVYMVHLTITLTQHLYSHIFLISHIREHSPSSKLKQKFPSNSDLFELTPPTPPFVKNPPSLRERFSITSPPTEFDYVKLAGRADLNLERLGLRAGWMKLLSGWKYLLNRLPKRHRWQPV